MISDTLVNKQHPDAEEQSTLYGGPKTGFYLSATCRNTRLREPAVSFILQYRIAVMKSRLRLAKPRPTLGVVSTLPYGLRGLE